MAKQIKTPKLPSPNSVRRVPNLSTIPPLPNVPILISPSEYTRLIPKNAKLKAEEVISSLIMKKILEMGNLRFKLIDKILNTFLKYKGCPPKKELDRIIKLRNNMLRVLNRIQRTLRPIVKIFNALSKLIGLALIAIGIAELARIFFLTPAKIGVILTGLLDKLKFTNANLEKGSSILSRIGLALALISTCLSLIEKVVSQVIEILNKLDPQVKKCNKNAVLDPIDKELLEIAKKQKKAKNTFKNLAKIKKSKNLLKTSKKLLRLAKNKKQSKLNNLGGSNANLGGPNANLGGPNANLELNQINSLENRNLSLDSLADSFLEENDPNLSNFASQDPSFADLSDSLVDSNTILDLLSENDVNNLTFAAEILIDASEANLKELEDFDVSQETNTVINILDNINSNINSNILDNIKKDLNIILSNQQKTKEFIEKNEDLNLINLNGNDIFVDKQTYKGFILQIREIPFNDKIKRKRAVGLDKNGIVLIQTELSFTSNAQTLINELKFIIDRDNLKAY